MQRALVLFLLLCITACQSPTQSPPSPKQLRLNLRSEPTTLDPRKVSDILSYELQMLLFEGLMRNNSDGTLDLGQAQAIEISADRCTYTFHLRNTLWSDGTPVTAYDFESSWKEILDPSFPSLNAHLFYPIKNAEAVKKGTLSISDIGIHAKDPLTLIVTLEQPTPYFLDLTSFAAFCPTQKIANQHHPDWAYHANEHFISNGPYLLQEWKHHSALILRKNPLFWDRENIPCDTIHFSMIADEATALRLFEHKELDMIGGPLCPLPIEAAQALQKQGELQHKPIGCTTIIAFNTQEFPFNNLHIRKALSLVLNRHDLVEHITQLNEEIALNAIPPILKKSSSRAFFSDGDLSKAKEHFAQGLSELGMIKEQFPELTYLYSATEQHLKIAQEVQQQWHKTLGISVKLQACESKLLMSKLIAKEFTIAQSVWIAQVQDPFNILERFKSKDNAKNYCAWEHPEFIRLLDLSATQSGYERLATLEKAEELFIAEMPVAPLYHWQYTFLVQPELRDLKISTSGGLYAPNRDSCQTLHP